VKKEFVLYRRVRAFNAAGECYSTEHELFGEKLVYYHYPDIPGTPGENARHYLMGTWGVDLFSWRLEVSVLIFPLVWHFKRQANGDTVAFDEPDEPDTIPF